ncbi:MAG: aldo/keto reductase [Candidatus Shapirobacteria bacterium]|nr:aldo/keto reductase [Candidatus Shapirobacteria bacterium]
MNKTITLNNGNKIPILGLGTWKSINGSVGQAVKYAITQANYRHIDCASAYDNQSEIGQVFSEIIGSKINRKNLFITSKLWNTDHKKEDVPKACQQTLSDLQLEYLDLYLMHWGLSFKNNYSSKPEPISIRETWEAMEALVKKGLVKSIGVSNFTVMMIIDLLSYAKIKPVINQVEVHPYNSQVELIKFCHSQKIAVTAYSPLGGQSQLGGINLLDEDIIKKLAQKYNKSSSQIILNWGINRDIIIIPKSTHPTRILENSQIFDFNLTKEDQQQIDNLNQDYRTCDPINFWNIPYFK